MLTFAIASYTLLNRAFPLGVSFVELMRQAQLEASLKRALLNRTITFQRVELVKSDVNWLSEPPQVRLSVRSSEVLTPKQVRLLKEFVEKEMGQHFSSNSTQMPSIELYQKEVIKCC